MVGVMQTFSSNNLLNRANIIRQNRKNLKIEISDRAELIVYAPKDMKLDKIESLLESKLKWIQSKLDLMSQQYNKSKILLNYEQTFVCGEVYNIKPYSGSKVATQEKNLLVPQKYYDKNTQISAIKKWYKLLAQEIVLKRIEQLKNATKIAFKTVKIADFKAKWGSCDSKSNIKINWRIVMLPHATIDMVLLHELVHIIEFNHSKKFYDILQKYMPNWKNHRKLLKDNNYLLKLYRG